MTLEGLYWETYADQDEGDGFTLIGVGKNVEEITNINQQVIELKRRFGRGCDIKLYKSTQSCTPTK